MIELMELHVEIKLNQSPFRKLGIEGMNYTAKIAFFLELTKLSTLRTMKTYDTTSIHLSKHPRQSSFSKISIICFPTTFQLRRCRYSAKEVLARRAYFPVSAMTEEI